MRCALFTFKWLALVSSAVVAQTLESGADPSAVEHLATHASKANSKPLMGNSASATQNATGNSSSDTGGAGAAMARQREAGTTNENAARALKELEKDGN
jgi:hypothetical protein